MLNLPESLSLYRRVLVEEFLREWQFLHDVIAGRAQKRGDFTDKLIDIMTGSPLDILGATPIPGISVVSSGIKSAIEGMNAIRQNRHDDNISEQEYRLETEELHSLLETVALEACRRYQWAILVELKNVEVIKGVIPLAKIGVERMLVYIVRTKSPLTYYNLLNGLIAGHSGALVTQYFNHQLDKNNDAIFLSVIKRIKQKVGHTGFTIEGVYARSAFMTPDKKIASLFLSS